MKIKLLIPALVLVLILAFTACNSDDNGSGTSNDDAPTTPMAGEELSPTPTPAEAEELTPTPAEEEPEPEQEPAEEEPEPYEEEPYIPVATGIDATPEALAGRFATEGYEHYGYVEFFADGTFVVNMDFDSLDLGFYIPGDISLGGTFEIDNSANVVRAHFDIEQVLDFAEDLIEIIIEQTIEEIVYEEYDGDWDAAEEFLEEFMMMMLFIMDSLFEEMLEEILYEFDQLTLRIGDNLDRLYDDNEGVVMVRV